MSDLVIRVHESGPEEGGIHGTDAVMVKKDAPCPDCGQEHDFEVCPKCGADIILGFGLAGGPGYGPWKMCEKYCGWSWKLMLPWNED